MRSRWIGVAVSLLALVAVNVPPDPADAAVGAGTRTINIGGASGMAECSGVGIVRNPGGLESGGMDIAVRGTATIAGATNVSIICHVWQSGGGHDHVGGVGAPGVATAAGIATGFSIGHFEMCPEVYITTLSGGYLIPCH